MRYDVEFTAKAYEYVLPEYDVFTETFTVNTKSELYDAIDEYMANDEEIVSFSIINSFDDSFANFTVNDAYAFIADGQYYVGQVWGFVSDDAFSSKPKKSSKKIDFLLYCENNTYYSNLFDDDAKHISFPPKKIKIISRIDTDKDFDNATAHCINI